MAQQFEYAHPKISERRIFFDGACLDGTFGILINPADSEDEALILFQNDPLVKSDIVDTERRKFRVGVYTDSVTLQVVELISAYFIGTLIA
ncbi:hypothetical protein [Alicyclobacillus fastidiosus]|uniref:Uncharacterized protein n=1 Tax=Alicyclobacillus fastidiosus TaxID=392011 RepID=A0ABV5ALY2_9BACL|nr:hypothetical protein [Alicyclobacillus fastidiosus]WEH08237.1 hypothetical protein PYS47_16220 [Alicyclobacillus fastidiosus]